jgi:hypothetical protein
MHWQIEKTYFLTGYHITKNKLREKFKTQHSWKKEDVSP